MKRDLGLATPANRVEACTALIAHESDGAKRCDAPGAINHRCYNALSPLSVPLFRAAKCAGWSDRCDAMLSSSPRDMLSDIQPTEDVMRIARSLAALACFALLSIAVNDRAVADPPTGDTQGWRYEPKKLPPGGEKSSVWDDGLKPVTGDNAGATAIEYGKGVKKPNPAAGIWDDGHKPTPGGKKSTIWDDGH